EPRPGDLVARTRPRADLRCRMGSAEIARFRQARHGLARCDCKPAPRTKRARRAHPRGHHTDSARRGAGPREHAARADDARHSRHNPFRTGAWLAGATDLQVAAAEELGQVMNRRRFRFPYAFVITLIVALAAFFLLPTPAFASEPSTTAAGSLPGITAVTVQ